MNFSDAGNGFLLRKLCIEKTNTELFLSELQE